jgi:hypothetical protein
MDKIQMKRKERGSGRRDVFHRVFENLAGTKNLEATESVTFYKIQKKIGEI